MTRIIGQIDSLKKIRAALNEKGIDDFNSIKEINLFFSSYDSQVASIKQNTEQELDRKMEYSIARKIKLENRRARILESVTAIGEDHIYSLENDKQKLQGLLPSNVIQKCWRGCRIFLINRKLENLKKKSAGKLEESVMEVQSELDQLTFFMRKYEKERDSLIVEYSDDKLYAIAKKKKVLEELRPLIAGAVGENKVQKELQRLPDNNTVFNDLYLEFDPPIYNKHTQERILTIQVDHLLVSRNGIFAIETKNWSKANLSNESFRSPIEQVQRSGYALFVLLNGKNKGKVNLSLSHMWSDQKIGVKSLLVFTGEKPAKKFKNVKILSLDQLVGYIEYFEPIYTDKELDKIVNYFLKLQA